MMEVLFRPVEQLDPVTVYAAFVATAVFLWDIVKWFDQGPRLKLKVVIPMEIITHGIGKEEGTFASVTATNVGNHRTTITHLALIYWPSLLSKILRRNAKHMFVPRPTIVGTSYTIPFDLEVGKQWTGAVNYDQIKAMADEGFLYFDIYHTLARKPARIRIKEKRPRRIATTGKSV